MSSERVIIEREVFIAAIPETVFGFLTDPAFMAQWIGLSHTPDPRPDGVFRLEFPWGRDGKYVSLTSGVYAESHGVPFSHRRQVQQRRFHSFRGATTRLHSCDLQLSIACQPPNVTRVAEFSRS